MRVLVTGSGGLVGSAVLRCLSEGGIEVVPFDLREGQDVLNGASLVSAAQGCDTIVHAAALVEPVPGRPDLLYRVNVEGTAHVLAAGETTGVRRIVFLSTLSVLGVFKGHRPPDYLPLDQDHPCYPSTEYEASKLEGERLCSELATSTGTSVVTLRVPGVWSPSTYDTIWRARERDPTFEWLPYWEYGAFLDVRDLSQACRAAIHAETEGHMILLLSSSDLTTSGPTARQWVKRIHPDVEWRGGDVFDREPYGSLVRIDRAREILAWEPTHTWAAYLESRSTG